MEYDKVEDELTEITKEQMEYLTNRAAANPMRLTVWVRLEHTISKWIKPFVKEVR